MENLIRITGGYMGKGKIMAYIDDKEYIMDIDAVEALLLKMAEEKGYTLSKTKRQKYTRLIINN